MVIATLDRLTTVAIYQVSGPVVCRGYIKLSVSDGFHVVQTTTLNKQVKDHTMVFRDENVSLGT